MVPAEPGTGALGRGGRRDAVPGDRRQHDVRGRRPDRGWPAQENEMRATAARRKAQAQLIDLATASGLSAAHQHEHAQALLWFTHAVRLADDDPERQRISRIRVCNWNEWVIQPDFRLALPGFENIQDRFLAFEFHISGRFLLVLSTTGAGSIWDLDRRAELPIPDAPARLSAAAYSPDGRSLALGTPGGKVEVRDFPTMKLAAGWDTEGTSVTALAFSLDAHRLAISDRRGARVWDVERRTFLTPRPCRTPPVETIRFDGAGRRLVTVAGDGIARTRLPWPTIRSSRSLLPRPPFTGQFRGLTRRGGISPPVRRWRPGASDGQEMEQQERRPRLAGRGDGGRPAHEQSSRDGRTIDEPERRSRRQDRSRLLEQRRPDLPGAQGRPRRRHPTRGYVVRGRHVLPLGRRTHDSSGSILW